ncbi:MAG: response regulator [Desulfobacterales bacterium]|nr:MAG: response regulator [Desulfobacterales bacterium]
MKILIAEDESITRLMVQVNLENWGYTVVAAEDGQKALSLLEKDETIAIAILDWEMPELDGTEVCQRVKELKRYNPVYVLMLTARDSQEDILGGFDAGVDDYVTKPFNDNELRARIRVAERLVRIQSSLSGYVQELQRTLDLVDTLQGAVPVCSICKKIEGVTGSWFTLEQLLDSNDDFRLVQTVCPDCEK